MNRDDSSTHLRVGVIVLHYYYGRLLTECLASIEAQTQPADCIVVVDNGSEPSDAIWLRGRHRDIDWRPSPRNLGYAEGMNAGARLLPDMEAFLFITQDCRLHPEALSRLSQALTDPTVAMVGPLVGLASAPSDVWSAGGRIRRLTYQVDNIRTPAQVSAWGGSSGRRVDWLDGAALLVRRSVFDELGGFDEGYFLYFEDVDLAVRVRDRGLQVVCEPSALAWQQPGTLTTYASTRNHLRFVFRCGPTDAKILAVAQHLLYLCADVALSPSARRRVKLRQRTAGIRDAFTGRLRVELLKADREAR